MQIARRCVGAMLLSVLVFVASLCISVVGPVELAHAITTGDDYPAKWKNAPLDSAIDDWGFYTRECTSWAAHALATRNGFKMSPPKGNSGAADWGVTASNGGYTPDMKPAVGSIAWWAANAGGMGPKGHVAWVESVNSDGSVTIEEYNWLVRSVFDGAYHQRTIAANAPSGYVHFKDLNGSTSSSTTSGGTVDASGFFHGVPADGMIVENVDGGHHLYSIAGGRAFWFDRNNSGLWLALLGQMKRLHGNGANVLGMHDAEIHAIEANYPSARSHPPRDNAFMYQYGDGQQYVAMYQYMFPVGSSQEIDYLGGRDKAVMVGPGSLGQQTGVPTIPNDVLLRTLYDPAVYHTVFGVGHWVDNDTLLECIKTVKHGAMQPVPVSLMSALRNNGRLTADVSHCSFPPEWSVRGQGGVEQYRLDGANPYTRHLYGSPLAEHCRLGAHPAEVQISVAGINQAAMGSVLDCPNNTYVRIIGNGETFRWNDGALHYIPWSSMLECLTYGHTEVVIDVDGPVVGNTLRGNWATCSFEGRLLLAPNGQVDYVKDGKRQHVLNPAIRDCIMGRAGSGKTISVSWDTFNSYSDSGRLAYCPYSANTNFVKENNSSTVWRILPNGSKQHASGFCVVDPFTTVLTRFHVYEVPAGETAGHSWDGSVWWPTSDNCAALT